MDPLLEHDLQIAQKTSAAEKLAQALDLMKTGIRLKRAALRVERPSDTEEEIERALESWLTSDG